MQSPTDHLKDSIVDLDEKIDKTNELLTNILNLLNNFKNKYDNEKLE